MFIMIMVLYHCIVSTINYTLHTMCTLNDYQYSFQIEGAYSHGVAQSIVLRVHVSDLANLSGLYNSLSGSNH